MRGLSVRKRPVVELPEYVRRVVSRGREYFYFQRGRGTANEEPVKRLPGHPHSVAFWQAYNEALGEKHVSRGRVADLIGVYKGSPEFGRLAETTKRDYLRYLAIIETAWGDLQARGVRPKHAISLRDAYADAPVAANHLVSIGKTLFNFGIPREFCETNPFSMIPKIPVDDKGSPPWPAWAFGLIDDFGWEDLQRAVVLAAYTGQRQEDVIRMAKSDLEDGGIVVTQLKTAKTLWIPLHKDLVAKMATWEVGPPWTFVQSTKGQVYTPERFRARWTRLMRGTPAGRIRAQGFKFHGLRSSSVENLREAGCSDAEISSITGMSPAMIRRYSRFGDQRRLAKAAILRLERTGQER